MKTWGCMAALLVLTGCINVSLEKKKKDADAPSTASHAAVADSALVPAISAFSIDLYRQLSAQPGNLSFSPLSISTVLTALVPGAAGTTQAEMLRVLHLAGPASYAKLMMDLDAHARAGGAQWTMANRAWVQSGMNVSSDFVTATRDGFGFDIGLVDFASAAEPARAAINQWIENETKDRIKDLFPPGSVTSDMRLVLANAIYFKGLWDSQFDKKNTTDAPFHLDAQNTAQVPMMSQTHRFGFRKVEGGRVLELPYKGNELSMLIVLPDEVNGLPSWEGMLSPEALHDWLRVDQREVIVSLPRFTAKQLFKLNKTLTDMGMPTAFEGAADFSGIDGKRDLYLGIVVHGAFVDVNEEGTEAAAATGAGITLQSEVVPETFTADHPFLFLIRDRVTGCILFMGRVTDPRG
jgi:serpin B